MQDTLSNSSLTNKQYPTGPDVIYTYDELFSSNPKGRLTTVSDLSGTTKYYYDKLGRVTSTVKNVDGVDYATDSTYDARTLTPNVSIFPSVILKSGDVGC